MNKINRTTMRLFAALFLISGLMVIQLHASPPPAINGKIAFTSDRDGNNEIYVMNADGTGQTRLTNNSVSDFYPTWSPNGKQIAFLREKLGIYSINLMNADGTYVRQITTLAFAGNGLSWSPDGSKIAFSHSTDIYTINVDGTGRVNLTNGGYNYEPSWSPDGSHIAFSRWVSSANTLIYVMKADGRDVHQVTDCQGLPYCSEISPDWSPDGALIVFRHIEDWKNHLESNSLVRTDGYLVAQGGRNRVH